MLRALVTGAAGFIGSHAVDGFTAAGYQVVALDDLSTGKRRNLPQDVDLRVIDVGSPEAARLVEHGEFDVIAHFAAQMDVRRSIDDPRFDARTNILGALNLLEAVRALPPERRPRIIFASTGGALYGDDAPIPSAEETATNPDAPYGVAKLAVEYYLAYYARIWRLETVALRFGNVYGPRQNPHGDAGVIAMFAKRMALGQPVTIFGSGTQTRDFVYVGDVVEAFLSAATAQLPEPGGVTARAFNIGTGIETPVLDLANMLANAAGVAPQIEFKPARSGEVDRSLLAPGKADRLLHWRSRVGLAEGLALTYSWVRDGGLSEQ